MTQSASVTAQKLTDTPWGGDVTVTETLYTAPDWSNDLSVAGSLCLFPFVKIDLYVR